MFQGDSLRRPTLQSQHRPSVLSLERLKCGDLPGNVVEFGCGYGTFTIAAARRASGIVDALDIDPSMVSATIDRATQARRDRRRCARRGRAENTQCARERPMGLLGRLASFAQLALVVSSSADKG
jgi:ribosomal protein L11 methylase PrmA